MDNQVNRFETLAGKINSTCKKVDREIEMRVRHLIEQMDQSKNTEEGNGGGNG